MVISAAFVTAGAVWGVFVIGPPKQVPQKAQFIPNRQEETMAPGHAYNYSPSSSTSGTRTTSRLELFRLQLKFLWRVLQSKVSWFVGVLLTLLL